MKKLITIVAVLFLTVSAIYSQSWVNEGAFTDTSYAGGVHGVVVDPDGKVWVSNYYQDGVYGDDSVATAPIYVFNADGTEASFSPINTIATGGGFTVDTLNGHCRGLAKDENGNIIYVQSTSNKMFKIDYKTGEGIARVDLTEPGSSPTAPSVSSDGTIYVGPVVGGGTNQIAMYDTDLNYIGAAVTGPPAIARTLEITPDGLTLLWMPFTAQKTYVYTRADEFSEFALTDSIHIGMSIESSTWNPVTGDLWISNDVRGKDITKGHLAWYAYNLESKTFVDMLTWDQSLNPEDGVYYARGIDFTADGNTAYLGLFRQSGESPNRLQKVVFDSNATATNPVIDIEKWTNVGSFVDTTYAGGVHGVAVDPDGKVWVSNYYRDGVYGDDSVATVPIYVFNPDGTEASFSPINTIATGGGFTIDTLNGHCRGLAKDENGNIIYVQSTSNKMFKIDYKTGEGIARVDLTEPGSSPTAPSVSSDGTIYVGPVVGGDGKQIAMYDTDLNYIGSAVDAPPAIARTLEVSPDGLSLYWMPFTAQKTYVYTRADEFSEFALTDSIHIGMSIESSIWNPVTGDLWVSSDKRSKDITKGHLTWYAYNVESKTFVDMLTWDQSLNPEDGLYYARGIDFTADGNDAFLGVFRQSGSNPNRIQKVTLTPDGVKLNDSEIPTGYSLSQNYPNPFNPTTMINFSIPESGLVTLKIFDILGQEVAELVNEVKPAGSYQVDFNAAKLSSGMYIYRISAGKFNATRKMMLLK